MDDVFDKFEWLVLDWKFEVDDVVWWDCVLFEKLMKFCICFWCKSNFWWVESFLSFNFLKVCVNVCFCFVVCWKKKKLMDLIVVVVFVEII